MESDAEVEVEQRPKRQKRDSSYKSKAFEKFQQLKSGSRKKYEVEEIENVYETVDEKEYVKKVLARQDDDWIVDDDGSGYIEDGRDIFDDDLDSESIAQVKEKGKGVKRKKKAVSENAGKGGNLQHMLSNMQSMKKKEEVKLENDDDLSALLDEINEVRPSTSSSSKREAKSGNNFKLGQEAINDYRKSFNAPPKLTPIKRTVTKVKPRIVARAPSPDGILKEVHDNVEVKKSPAKEEIPVDFNDDDDFEEMVNASSAVDSSILESEMDETVLDEFDNDFDETTALIEDNADLYAEFSVEWDTEMDTSCEQVVSSNLPLVDIEGKKLFRFYWWDAFEDIEKQRGSVFLFGKTFCDKSKSYVSCCVVVRNIMRRIFVLPRPFKQDICGNNTTEPVTQKDLYNEFNSTMKSYGVKSFLMKFVQKKYAFDPEIPTESDYMEVRYPATDPVIADQGLQGSTYSKIFGLNSSFLEIFLMERKIKGPCWLDIFEPVWISNPLSSSQYEVNCMKTAHVTLSVTSKPLPPPPLVVAAINFRSFYNRNTSANEIVMATCLAQSKYSVDKGIPQPPFQQHFCVFSGPSSDVLPLNIQDALSKYKGTNVQKLNGEKALLNVFLAKLARIDPDLIVGHDLQGYQITVLAESLRRTGNTIFSKLGRLKRSAKLPKFDINLFVGRLLCDIKVSAKELIKSRSYDLDALCQSVLHLKEGRRVDLEPEEIPKMFKTAPNILKLISLTMQDTEYILKIMYELNCIPLALQITNIAGNVMSKTLLGGRAERNEFLLLHAFSEKNYIVPDKEFKRKSGESTNARKKATYSGGLVLEPKVGFYDTMILLMDFNSLYPSIIQEYNICFTTLKISDVEDDFTLPESNLPAGVLPTEIRKLVESRREVKKLMNNPDLSSELKMQYHIRQMALKLTANSMYGCLGFSNSRFYAKNLAALVTYKGREILTNTKDLAIKLGFDVVYGDTDSIMINTYKSDYNQVMKMGVQIKQEVNKLYKQVELDIDGVFKYLLLLKKKKYAALVISKSKSGELKLAKEYKGLDIVRRDWSQLASDAGKYILDYILSDQALDESIRCIREYLERIRDDLHAAKVPVPLLTITKQLTKDPKLYVNNKSLPHVQVALRYNERSGGRLRAGDTVPYVICDDGSQQNATQRAYHVDEFKNSKELKIDARYYLEFQVLPVVLRIIEQYNGIDPFEVALCLGLDNSAIKVAAVKTDVKNENILAPEIRFRKADSFKFKCKTCGTENNIEAGSRAPFLLKCADSACSIRPVANLVGVRNALILQIRKVVKQFYLNHLACEDPSCTFETRRTPMRFYNNYPVCPKCGQAFLLEKYPAKDLYLQLLSYQHLFDVANFNRKKLDEEVEAGYKILYDTVNVYLAESKYSQVDLSDMFSRCFD